jgi:hypothetical protein
MDKAMVEFGRELDLHFDEEILERLHRLLDGGMNPDSLIQLLRDIRSELFDELEYGRGHDSGRRG